MKSAPFSNASIWLCSTTSGLPGITPDSRSSRLGPVAEVIATDSPSHDKPAEIHRTWTVICSAWDATGPATLRFATNAPFAEVPSSIGKPRQPADRTFVQRTRTYRAGDGVAG